MKVILHTCIAGALLFFAGCSKSGKVNISGQQFAAGSYIQAGDTLNSKNGSNGRAIKGTLESGKIYYLCSLYADATVNSGDTLVVQSGVKVLVIGPTSGAGAIGTQDHAPGIVVNGTFLCLGTKTQPNLFTVGDAALKSDPARDPQDPNTDPAFKGYWGGIQGGAGSGDIIIKWTRFEYLGGLAPLSAPSRAGQARYGILVTNPACNFVLEDCWLYGSNNDMIRPAGCKYEIYRNTFEKVGFSAGECVNVKSGSVGDIAYNLVVGGTGNAFKSANAGGLSPQANMNCYNNTVVATGYRQAKAGEGGSIDFENGGRGNAYNNMIIDCAYGLSILGGGGSTPAADTANVHYGYTYNYGDNTSIVTQFLPVGFITMAQSTDINGGNATTPGANNPRFVNYPLPLAGTTNFNTVDYVGSFDFHLQSGSPALGKGYTGFAAYGSVKVDPIFGVTELTPPGKDMGAYQSDGTGNQH
ncbi:MAG TPA: hypothetical protein VG605_13205 [Puia sp.]|nr:hypothetical protein [Puia sp.]